ncbi:hypothetical protein SSCG_01928 [Streptomyces clavuligerus]|nr:hypothetical protein SSCG_01928 [Streptomyces clavuligerus]
MSICRASGGIGFFSASMKELCTRDGLSHGPGRPPRSPYWGS